MSKEKVIGVAVALILASGTVLSSMAFVANVIVVYPKWTILKAEFVVEWFNSLQTSALLGWLTPAYVVTVDLSTVTTGLVAFTFTYATVGSVRVIFEKMPKDVKCFPFWTGYKNIYVQLGLLGTIWGFIIAFQDISQEDTTTMLLALGTALWSTFTAIFFAFLVCPLIFEKLIFGYLLNVHENTELSTGDNSVQEDVQEISNAFEELSEQVGSTTERIDRLGKGIDYFESIRTSLKRISDIEKELNTSKGKIDKVRKDESALKQEVSKLVTQITTFEQNRKENEYLSEKRFLKLESTVERVVERLAPVESEIRNNKKTKEVLETIKRLLNRGLH